MKAAEDVTLSVSTHEREMPGRPRRLPVWMRVSAVAAASAVAGGLAAFWFYRKAITRLQSTPETNEYSDFHIPGEGMDDES